MLVFRDGSKRTEADVLKRAVLGLVKSSPRQPLPVLLKWGELESALEDAGVVDLGAIREVSLRLARLCLAPNAYVDQTMLQSVLESIEWPRTLVTRNPEGYCYYALDPMSYARLVAREDSCSGRAVVVGVRSIGTSLSALVCASLEQKGTHVLRFTVRPSGDAWNRRLVLPSETEHTLCAMSDVPYWVVDEGPGLSGSTFLAVGEALVRAGVPPRAVTFVCSHEPDVESLQAPDAVRRWGEFRTIVAERVAREAGARDISAGRWRTLKYSREQLWPATWPQLEREKYLCSDGREIERFIGFAPYNEDAELCAMQLADAGFAPKSFADDSGFLVQPWIPLAPCSCDDAPHAIRRIADYLAFRALHLRAEALSTDGLECMTKSNVREAFGIELQIDLELARPVRPDARMMPHEWLVSTSGKLVKTDGHDHGDDHLYPGPCDIAWDIAGAIVEWSLGDAEASALTSRYTQLTGDRVNDRLAAYVVAYLAFRVGYVQMASARTDSNERTRLERATAFYRHELTTLLRGFRQPAR